MPRPPTPDFGRFSGCAAAVAQHDEAAATVAMTASRSRMPVADGLHPVRPRVVDLLGRTASLGVSLFLHPLDLIPAGRHRELAVDRRPPYRGVGVRVPPLTKPVAWTRRHHCSISPTRSSGTGYSGGPCSLMVVARLAVTARRSGSPKYCRHMYRSVGVPTGAVRQPAGSRR